MSINQYGDERRLAQGGFGVDIATQRADDLDNLALEFLRGITLHRPRALDVACGAGGQALRMVQAGAEVTAVDIEDYSEAIAASCRGAGLSPVRFLRADMTRLPWATGFGFDTVVCQRAIHYLPYPDARQAVREFVDRLCPGGRLYLSASGIRSELGNGYGGHDTPLTLRYAPLDPAMVQKHGIHGPVCLYGEDDLLTLLEGTGLTVLQVFSSPFGNVKAVALHE